MYQCVAMERANTSICNSLNPETSASIRHSIDYVISFSDSDTDEIPR